MKLPHINDLVCPFCKSEVCLESNTDSSGYSVETRQFKCGYTLHYLAQFGQLEVKQECPNDRRYIIKRRKQVRALKTLFRDIRKLKVDIDFKEELMSAIITKFVK